MYRITFLIQGIIGFQQNDDGTLGIGVPDTTTEQTLGGSKLRKHDPMVVLSWREETTQQTTRYVPDEFIRLGRRSQVDASVVPGGNLPPVPPRKGPRMADILPPSENCQWVRDRLLFPRFDLPRGQLGGWPGNRGYGTMKNTQGVDLAPPDLGAEWTIQVRTRDRFTLEIESEDRTTVITMGSERTIWLVNHPQDHTDPTPGDPETDFLWYYWMLSRNSGPWPVPTSPEADVDVPHIATAGWPKPRSVVAEAARDPVGTGGQLCRPCEFCPGGG